MSPIAEIRPDDIQDCREFAQRLEVLLDGELEGSLADAALKHLQRCPGCQRRADHAWRYREAMQRARDADRVAPEMLERVRLLLRHAITPQQPPAH
ncbi:MAG: zf-HC2 domain-containing protein [Gemmatimonadetes bacterium]|nr:zf-HC2 domain-containing protein [Gemmatimonadota bacterium]